MKFPSIVFAATAVLLVPNALALSPTNCNTADKSRTGSDFVLVEQPDNPNVASLSKKLKTVSVADVFNDGNHKMTADSAGRKLWEKNTGFNDLDTEKWVPQGISSTADASEGGTVGGKDGWIVSWHRDDDKSVRVTFVDRANDKYRHALLIYPHAADNFREVPIHAGGIMWYGDKLWVVDTKNGIRVFDMANIWQVGSGDAVGKTGSKYSAAGYKYVIPQIRLAISPSLQHQTPLTICSTKLGGTNGLPHSPSASPTWHWTAPRISTPFWLASTSPTPRFQSV
jgi:hypothetical protein